MGDIIDFETYKKAHKKKRSEWKTVDPLISRTEVLTLIRASIEYLKGDPEEFAGRTISLSEFEAMIIRMVCELEVKG